MKKIIVTLILIIFFSANAIAATLYDALNETFRNNTELNAERENINASVEDINRKKSIERSLEYMGLEPDQEINKIKIDKVFIGSCTNGRIEDLREVARVVKGKKVSVDSMIVPGSGLVKEQAESEGLDKIFIEAGFDWREPGCSMCLAMNPDQLKPKERCASTSNRNFEGRQGREGRTHLVSPAIAAASAIKGSFSTVEDL